MTEKRFTIDEDGNITDTINDRCLYVENRMTECDYFVKLLNEQYEDLMTCHSYLSSKTNVENENAELRKENEQLKKILGFLENDNAEDILNVLNSQENRIWKLKQENEQLKAQLYCDDEEGICNICKHHYLVKDDEAELGYYNSRCKKGHYECARISLKYCDDFEKGDVE